MMVCPCCQYIFPPSGEEKITAKADDTTPVLSTEKPWAEVIGKRYAFHPAKVEGNPPSVKVTYDIEGRKVSSWLCPQHLEHPDPKSWKAKSFSDRHWSEHGGKRPFPSTVDEFLDRAGELRATTQIQLDFSRDQKFPNVVAIRSGDASYTTDLPSAAKPPTGNLAIALAGSRAADTSAREAERARLRAAAQAFLDDDIPF
jgi:DNA repair protein RadD